MASSGIITNDFRTGYRLQIVWQVNSQDVGGNTSNVTASVQLVSTGSSYTISSTASKNVSLTINGTTYTGTCTVGISGLQTKTLFTQTVNVPHDSDGTKVCSFSSTVGLNVTLSGVYWGDVSVSGNGTFDTIARASQPSLSSSSPNMDSAIIIYTNRASTGFTHTISYSFGNSSGTIATSIADSCSWTPPLSLANEIPNSTSGTCTITCDTYNGGTYIGSKSVGITLNVPTSVVPTLSGVTHSENNTTVSSTVGLYVQSLSNIKISITGASGAYGSSISNYTITVNGVSYNASSIDTGSINWSGTVTVRGMIVDSRGRSAYRDISISALAYSPPVVTKFSLSRCNSDGTANDMGTYVRVVSTGQVTSLVNGGVQKNSLTYIVESSPRSANTWTTKLNKAMSGLSLDGSSSGNDVMGTYSEINAFDFRISLKDKFNTTMSVNILPTGTVAMSWSKNGVGVGKVWQQGALDVGKDGLYLDGDLTLRKNGYWSNILFNAQTNDPAFIKHYENNNNAVMYFSVSDDKDANDCFSFGSSPSGTYQEGVRIYSNGKTITNDRLYQYSNQLVWSSGDFALAGGQRNLNISGQDLNGIIGTGLYCGQNCPNNPYDSWFYYIVQRHVDDSWVSQTAINYFSNEVYLRWRREGNWSGWSRYVFTNDSPTFQRVDTTYGSYVADDIASNKNVYSNGGAGSGHMTMGNANEIWATSGAVYLNFRGGSGLIVGNGSATSGAYGPIYGSTKSAVIGTDNFGEQILYCDESPNHVFHDSGTGVLDENGECYIFIDPILLEGINTKMADYQVYLTSYKGANAEILDKSSEYFVVCGTPNAKFDWLIRAERKGMERLRFNEADITV